MQKSMIQSECGDSFGVYASSSTRSRDIPTYRSPISWARLADRHLSVRGNKVLLKHNGNVATMKRTTFKEFLAGIVRACIPSLRLVVSNPVTSVLNAEAGDDSFAKRLENGTASYAARIDRRGAYLGRQP